MDDYYVYDISNFIKEFSLEYSDTNENNLFFTTSALRDYHYLKQKNNAYYHIQAINLPFQNIEFYYIAYFKYSYNTRKHYLSCKHTLFFHCEHKNNCCNTDNN